MEEKSLKILALQMASVIADKNANFINVETLLENAFSTINSDVDLIVLPEVWSVGWSCSDFVASAETIENSATIDFLAAIAKKYNANVIGGSFITVDNKCNYYNTCPVLDRNGRLLATYDKMHLFSYFGCDEGSYLKSGKTPLMVNIEGVNVGISICYDIRFPEIYRAYRKAGADLLVDVAAWSITKKNQWKILTKCRAIENQCFMVAVNQSGLINNDENLGDSRIIDYLGNTVAKIEGGEGAIFAVIKLNDMYKFRQKCTILNDIHNNYNVRKI